MPCLVSNPEVEAPFEVEITFGNRSVGSIFAVHFELCDTLTPHLTVLVPSFA